MANGIEFAKNHTGILDEIYQRAAVQCCLNRDRCTGSAGPNAKEVLIPKISVTGLGDYTRNVGYKTGSVTYEYETHSFGNDWAIRLFADVMDVEGAVCSTASSRRARSYRAPRSSSASSRMRA